MPTSLILFVPSIPSLPRGDCRSNNLIGSISVLRIREAPVTDPGYAKYSPELVSKSPS